MNEEARQELDRILALEPAALSEEDMAFLRARRSYLTEEQRINFAVADEGSAKVEVAPNEEVEASRARRGRKPLVEPASELA